MPRRERRHLANHGIFYLKHPDLLSSDPHCKAARRPGRAAASWYKSAVAEKLNELLADKATLLVRENFTGVRAEWWWERRMGGGIEICQELDPATMSREVSGKTGQNAPEVRRYIENELGLEDDEPVVLTFEIAGDVTVTEAARMLQERSSRPEGLAAAIYAEVEGFLKNG